MTMLGTGRDEQQGKLISKIGALGLNPRARQERGNCGQFYSTGPGERSVELQLALFSPTGAEEGMVTLVDSTGAVTD